MSLTCAHPDQIEPGARAESEHPVARSAEPGEDWSWCYVDQTASVIEPRDAA